MPVLSPWREGREEEGMEGGSWEKELEKKRESKPGGRGERDRGGKERMGRNILHFGAKIPQTVGKTML